MAIAKEDTKDGFYRARWVTISVLTRAASMKPTTED